MDDFDSKVSTQADLSELTAQTESLHYLIGSILILVVVLSGVFNMFLLRQYMDVNGARGQLRALVDQYAKVDGPGTEYFLSRMLDYGQTHADFQPILARYGLRTTVATNAPSAAPVPAPGASNKK